MFDTSDKIKSIFISHSKFHIQVQYLRLVILILIVYIMIDLIDFLIDNFIDLVLHNLYTDSYFHIERFDAEKMEKKRF